MSCSREKRYHAGSSRFSLLQAMESWAEPRNEAITTLDDMIHMHCTGHSQIPLQADRQWSIVAHGNMTRYRLCLHSTTIKRDLLSEHWHIQKYEVV